MRHKKKKITLDRKTAARRSLLANLAESLILYEQVKTTKAKAKATQSYVEKLITMAKANTLAARRNLLSILYTKNAVKKLMEVLCPRYKTRAGGYTRITLVGQRRGDAAEQAVIQLI